jgi:hypothetical protein
MITAHAGGLNQWLFNNILYEGSDMPKFMIEREIPGAGDMSQEERQGGAAMSNEVIDKLGNQIQWVHSYLTQNKFYCVYIAPNADIILQHAEMSGFPADRVEEVKGLLDSTTAQ